MTAAGSRVWVGFGFGAIQAGLFLLEAHRAGRSTGAPRFGRLVVIEVVPEVVAALRAAGGLFDVNVATANGIERVRVGPIDIYDPAVEEDRRAIVEEIAASSELGTAVPSVEFYVSEGPASLHRVLADGLALKIERDGPRAVVYAAENHNEAAGTLERITRDVMPAGPRRRLREYVRFLETVIGKMSGVVTDAAEIEARGLALAVPSGDPGRGRAFLVEEFNRILVSRVDFDEPFERGLDVFEEKPDLLPFEEAKLYGHNACHALAAYVGAAGGVERIADVARMPGGMAFLRAALIEESGEPLIAKHGGLDGLFSHTGFRDYADDLLPRMVNPHLADTIERVGRDPGRKLAWSDRLVGAMRLALEHDTAPRRYAIGVAAALLRLDPELATGRAPDREAVAVSLERIWGDAAARDEVSRIVSLVAAGLKRVRAWREGRVRDIELLVSLPA